MANCNTFAGLYNQTGPTSATETAIASASSSTTRAIVAMPTNSEFDGKPFKARVVSQGVASGACNFTVNLYWDSNANTNLTTFTGDVLVIGSGAQALASKSGTVLMEAICVWDSTLAQLAAFWIDSAGIANIPTTPAVIKTSGAVTATNPVTASGVATSDLLRFFVTHTMSANATSSKLIELAFDEI